MTIGTQTFDAPIENQEAKQLRAFMVGKKVQGYKTIAHQSLSIFEGSFAPGSLKGLVIIIDEAHRKRIACNV